MLYLNLLLGALPLVAFPSLLLLLSFLTDLGDLWSRLEMNSLWDGCIISQSLKGIHCESRQIRMRTSHWFDPWRMGNLTDDGMGACLFVYSWEMSVPFYSRVDLTADGPFDGLCLWFDIEVVNCTVGFYNSTWKSEQSQLRRILG